MIPAFPDWRKYIVRQRRPASGCIPTGYEILLRAAHADGIDLASFQDDFDLDKDLRPGDTPNNHFRSVASAVRKKYLSVEFNSTSFRNGEDKLEFIEDCLERGRPVLVSLALKPFGREGWHIMLVVEASKDSLVFLKSVDENGTPETLTLSKAEFGRIHNSYPGGDDVAYLERWK